MDEELLKPEHRARIDAWYAARDFVAIGNLGEQVTGQLLVTWGYQILATQDDLMGGVANILERPATENPEDFIVIDPDGRLITVNSKATVSGRSCAVLADGTLKPPRLRNQGHIDYYSMRAGLLSPLDDAATHGQVAKIDLIHLKAQVYEIEDNGQLSPTSEPVDIAPVVTKILDLHAGRTPPPRSEDFE